MEIYRQSRSKYWYVTVYVDGQRKRKSTMQTTRSAAMEAAMEMVRDARSEAPAIVASIPMPTIEQFAVETFIPFLDGCTLDPDTIRWYKNGWRMLSATLLKTAACPEGTPYRNTPLDQVRSSEVDMLRAPGGAYNMNCMRRSLRRMITLALEKEILKVRPKVKLMRETQRTAVYSPELERRMLEAAEQPLTDIFLLILDAGIRPNESLHLQWPDLLWDKSLIHVRGTKSEDSDRYVPMSDRVRQLLRVRAQGETSPWVFPSPRKKGYPLTPYPIHKRFGKLREALGIPKDLVLYSGRHTFATDLLDRTGNIKLVSEVLGHASVTTTERYVHPEKKGLAEQINERNASRAQEGENAMPKDFGHTFGHTRPILN